MKILINENKVKVADLNVNPVGLIPQRVLLRGVRLNYKTDEDGKRVSNEVVSVRYDVMDPSTLGTFAVRVDTSRPVITQEQIDSSEAPISIELPVNEIVIKPYKVEYGTAFVSVIAPAVKLLKN